jgi:propanol-preferring alcohol dehydrogenase
MKAARLVAFREPLRIEDLPVPEPGPGDALVRVTACGVCRSDWHRWNDDLAWLGLKPQLPMTLGHEIGGVIERVGEGVTKLAPGRRVTVPFVQSCGVCENCTGGRDNLCLKGQVAGFARDGGFAEYVLVRVADLNCVPLPDTISDEVAAALGCRFPTGYHAIAHRSGLHAGEWIAIFGAGGVGLSAIQTAAALGGRVIAIDIDAAKLERARVAGAVETIHAVEGVRIARRIKEIADGRGAHISVDAIATAPTTQAGIASLRPGGRHVQVGLTSQAEQGQIPIPADVMVTNELEFVGSGPNPHNAYDEIFDLIARGKLDPASLISRRISLSDITSVFHDFDTYSTKGLDVVTSFR